MRLCFGTYCSVLSVCLTPFGDTRKLCEEIFKTVAPNHGVIERDSSHAVARGKSNLPGDVLEAAADIDTPEKAKDVAQRFRTRVIKYLELNKRKEIVLALQDIIKMDDIGDDVVVDLVDGLTKAQIVGLKEFILHDFLAGIFLYTCQTGNSKMEKHVKEVTKDYVHGFANQAPFISFVGSYSASSIDVAKSIGADSIALALVAEAGGNCLKCGRKIASFAGGSGVDYATRVSLVPGEDAVLCVDCARQLHIKWVEVVYGKDTLEENLKFIADALGGKGSSREVIRNYFLNDFYTDHLKIYQKRPIYWLFDSGKKNGFKCLIYMHRYQPDTIARIRTDYVHEQQSRYRTAIAGLEQRVNDASIAERVKLNKQFQKLQAQAAELREYEEKIHHLADQMISIDLDDGVKVNYAKFQDVLAKIK